MHDDRYASKWSCMHNLAHKATLVPFPIIFTAFPVSQTFGVVESLDLLVLLDQSSNRYKDSSIRSLVWLP